MRRMLLTSCLGLLCGCASAHRPAALPATMPATRPLSQAILYENDRTWQTDKAAPMKLSEFKGRPVLMAMFFTTCSGTCGVTVNHLMQIRASLSAQEREQIDVVLVSFDSDNDTPAALARYRAERHLPAEWTLLRGPAECTRELADQLGVSYAPDSARHILHGTQIALLDANGHIVHRAVGTNADMDVVIGAIRAALAGTALPPLEAAVQPLKFAAEKKSCCNTN